MNFSDYLTLFFLFFLILGGIDKCLENKFGLGDGMERGFNCAGPLIMAMIGFTCFAPVFARWLQPVLTPVFTAMGADPSLFAGLLIANDSGGFPLALSLANDETVACYSGLLVASIMGVLIMFTIPVGFSSVTKEQRPLLIKGLLIGIITVPAGLILGGLFSGLSFKLWLLNTLPVLVVSVVLALCMWLIPNIIAKIMMVFGRFLSVVLIVTLVVSILDFKLDFINIDGLVSYTEGVKVVGEILIVLAGAFPFLNLIKKIFQKPLSRLCDKIDMNEESVMGLITLPINGIPTFAAMPQMNDRGLIVITAASVSMDFAIGDHLAYTLSVRPEYAAMVLVGKIGGGIAAVVLAMWMTRRKKTAGPAA